MRAVGMESVGDLGTLCFPLRGMTVTSSSPVRTKGSDFFSHHECHPGGQESWDEVCRGAAAKAWMDSR